LNNLLGNSVDDDESHGDSFDGQLGQRLDEERIEHLFRQREEE